MNNVTLKLNNASLAAIPSKNNLHLPPQGYAQLPERVLQFGTGVLLRGLPDYFIDIANRNGVFNGRVVVVKSTASGGTGEFDSQNSLYTIAERGIVNDNKIENYWVNSAISRVLTATTQWQSVLQCAEKAEMQVIISNTTEVGIVLQKEKVLDAVPQSFPGKLLAFLHKRFQYFHGAADAGMVMVPTELLTDNGSRLQAIVLELAAYNEMGNEFISWLQLHNFFCNTLVDRIVPGKPPAAEWQQLSQQLGYADELMISAEPFNLWAIEATSPRVKEILSFESVNEGMVIAPRIEKFRELKLRLLNGTHTFSCGLAHLAGFDTVKEALGDEQLSAFVRRLMMVEIAAGVPQDLVSYNEACVYANTVLDRFRNPFLEHKWLSISMNFTSKMRMRNIPLLQRYYQKHGEAPACMALGFAAYILFMQCEEKLPGQFVGNRNGLEYVIQDESAPFFARYWQNRDAASVAHNVCSNEAFWGVDLTSLPGWEKLVTRQLELLQQEGAVAILRAEHVIQTN